LLIFGPGKLAGSGKSFGEAIRNFRSAFREPEKLEDKPEKKSESGAEPGFSRDGVYLYAFFLR
jgi:TatA/E family protein of Tat protein translocase